MSVYSTEELINILASERRACMNGERLNLAASASGNPLLDKFLKPEGIQNLVLIEILKPLFTVISGNTKSQVLFGEN